MYHGYNDKFSNQSEKVYRRYKIYIYIYTTNIHIFNKSVLYSINNHLKHINKYERYALINYRCLLI